MEKADLYYKESGALGTMGPILMGVLGLIGSIALGAAYGYVIYYMPLVYLGFLATIACGVAMGFIIGKAALWGKVRNQKAVISFAALAGLLTVFFQWVFWLNALGAELVFSPLFVLDAMSGLAEEGIWEIFSFTPTGAILYLIWVIEAGIIIVGSVLFAMGVSVGKPYCENCDKWVETEILSSQLDRIVSTQKFIDEVEQQDFTILTSLEKVGHDALRRTKVELSTCKDCHKDHYLTVTQLDTVFDDEGKPEEEENELVANLIINGTTYQALKEWNKTLA